jgi:AcrR family transcriptional regulator
MPRLAAPKDRLYLIALELFSQRGFAGVSVREICAAAGIRESSLYNHYPSKQALLDRAILEMAEYMESPMLLERQPDTWAELGLRALLQGGVSLFLSAWGKPRLRQLWMALSHEQYGNPAVAALMNREQANRIAYTTDMFQALMDAGRMLPGSPRLLAMLYVHAVSSCKLEYVLRLHHGMEPEAHALKLRELADHFADLWEARPGRRRRTNPPHPGRKTPINGDRHDH